MLCIYVEMRFESLICGLDVGLSSLFVAFISMCFSLLEKPLFFKLNSFLTHPRQISFLSSLYLVISTDPRQILDPSIFLGLTSIASWQLGRSIELKLCALCLLDTFSIDSRSIEISGFHLNRSSIAFRSVETLLHALFFTCFASFYYLVIHSILFHYIHAFIWISCAPLIILDHLYVSRVKLSSFLYPLSIMTKRGRICGVWDSTS